jgi:hypothetical protein
VADFVTARLLASTQLTSILFVKGDAGAGKTTLLQEVTAMQARRVMAPSHPESMLFFYVSAQGRLLSNLPDALAAETQDLSARFRNDAVAVLARRHLLVPIIDGFDELLGTAGYGDAFSSLQTLLADLDGQGVIIVSARSSFFETDFASQARRFDESAYSLISIDLQPWTTERLTSYFELVNRDRVGDYMRMLDDMGSSDVALLHRPFFASAFPEYADARLATGKAPPIADHLIERYIEREAGKIVDINGSPLLGVDGHRRIFEEAAEQMWLNGDRRLNTEDLRALAAIVAEQEGLRGGDVVQFETKITSYAGFTVDSKADAFSFEHEVYFDYFLAQAAVRQFFERDIGVFLDRGVLTERVAGIVGNSVGDDDRLETLLSTPRQDASFENRRRNLGAIVAAISRRRTAVVGLELQHLDFVHTDFSNLRFERCRFVQCTFMGVTLAGTAFDDCIADRCTFADIAIDRSTRLGIVGVDALTAVGGLYDLDDDEAIFVPTAIAERLRRAGLGAAPNETAAAVPALGDNATKVVAVLQRMVRRFMRITLIAPDDDDSSSKRIFGDPAWPVLRALLLRHELIREETRSASGRRKIFIRPAVDFIALMARENERDGIDANHRLDAFWRDVRALDRKGR